MLLWIFFAVTVVVDSFNEPVCERYCSGRTGWHRRLHAAHVVDSDPDGLFARHGLRSGAPLHILWGRIVAANTTKDEDIAIFAFLRDNPCLYRRCPAFGLCVYSSTFFFRGLRWQDFEQLEATWEDLVIRQLRWGTRDTPPTVETMMALDPPLCGAAVFELYVTLLDMGWFFFISD